MASKKNGRNYSEVTDEIRSLCEMTVKNSQISPDLFTELRVKKGLRDVDGN